MPVCKAAGVCNLVFIAKVKYQPTPLTQNTVVFVYYIMVWRVVDTGRLAFVDMFGNLAAGDGWASILRLCIQTPVVCIEWLVATTISTNATLVPHTKQLER